MAWDIDEVIQLEHERLAHQQISGPYAGLHGTLNWTLCTETMCRDLRTALDKGSPGSKRQSTIVLDRETCDWVIDEKADSAICRTPGHREVADGVDSKHFPGRKHDR